MYPLIIWYIAMDHGHRNILTFLNYKMLGLSMAMLVMTKGLKTIKSHKTTMFLWFSYGFPMLFPCFPVGMHW